MNGDLPGIPPLVRVLVWAAVAVAIATGMVLWQMFGVPVALLGASLLCRAVPVILASTV